MPTVNENLERWGTKNEWANQGDEWSTAWGGPDMQWYGTLLPRIQGFVPAESILEIACGYGRWTQYLRKLCRKIVAVDIAEDCIQVCKRRFSDVHNIEYQVNDGKSLAMIPTDSIDFVFSFDSLVHADEAVLDAYISQLPRILRSNGAAFFHHSNLGEYSQIYARIEKLPMLRPLLSKVGILDKNLHWRDPGVSAKVVEDLAKRHGLKCLRQEVVHWGTKRLKIDCFTTIVRKSFAAEEGNIIYRNNNFMQEAANLLRLSHLYQRP